MIRYRGFVSVILLRGITLDSMRDNAPKIDRNEPLRWFTENHRAPPTHQIRHAPSSETMHGPMGFCGVQLFP